MQVLLLARGSAFGKAVNLHLVILTFVVVDVTTCIRQQQISKVVPGVFHPACQRNGSFNTMQHQPLTRDVYCVDKNGVQIEGTTRHMDFETLPDCTPYWNSKLLA